MIVAGLVAVVAVALIVALAGGGDEPKVTTAPGSSETRPVTVAGDALAPMPDSGDDPAVGATAPNLTGTTFSGVPIAVPSADKPTLTIFVAHWCPHCQKEVPLLTEWQNSGGVPGGVEVFAVSTSVDQTSVNYPPSDWLEREAFPFGVLADSDDREAATAMGVTGFPFFVMTDAEGTVLWRASGELPMDTLTTMITDSLAG